MSSMCVLTCRACVDILYSLCSCGTVYNAGAFLKTEFELFLDRPAPIGGRLRLTNELSAIVLKLDLLVLPKVIF